MSLPNGFHRRACLLLLIGLLPVAGGLRPQPPPTPADCRERLAAAADIDVACLREIYALPISQWPAPDISAGTVWQELGPLPVPAEPTDNPGTPEKIALGKRLFEDPRLSRSGQIACASCHDRQLGWGDGRSVSFGHDRLAGHRNAMNVSMAGHADSLFWDGRAATLEEQALIPIQDAREMAFTPRELEKRLNRDRDYRDEFARVFGNRRIAMHDVARALAAYQRSLSPRNGRFDRFLQGRRDQLDDEQLLGLHLFRTKARCMNCHNGPAFSDNRFHNLGLHYFGRKYQDLGRYHVTGDPADSGRFRTPSLRGVGKSGPYMHNGLFPSLEGVVNLYNVGGARPRPTPEQARDPHFPQTDPLLQPLQLQEAQREAIVAFLEIL